jgi:thiol-disulfide isomerase/thioredoxin
VVSTSRTRRGVLAGVGALAAAAGAGGWWWQPRSTVPDANTEALWALRFPRPEGGELLMADHRGTALLLNFWATWCPPCLKEMPALDRFARAQGQRVQVIGLAVDSLAPVQAFLSRQPVSFAVGLAGMSGTELARSLGNRAGVLPFTLLLDAQGKLVRHKVGETDFAELEAWAKRL